VKENVLKIRREWPFAAGHSFEGEINPDRIDDGFRSQHPGLPRALIMGKAPPQISSSGHAGYSRHACVSRDIQRVLIIQTHGIGALRVGGEQTGRDPADWHQPFGVGGLQVEWTGPDIFLILGQMNQEPGLVRMRNRTIDRDSGTLGWWGVSARRSCWLLCVQWKARVGTPKKQSESKFRQGVRQKGPLPSDMSPRRRESGAIN
jgi:hypothetical protein